MTAHSIPLIYHPTTVVFVDDSVRFLSNLSLQLDPRLAFRMFYSPHSVREEIFDDITAEIHPAQRYLSQYRDQTQSSHIVEFSLKAIHREAHNDDRFGRISVAVIDYDMPDVNGLELCRSIKDPSIKKILLTGKADERIAVQAFNEGIIDRFIRKQEPDAVDVINQTIDEMQHAYFASMQQALFEILSVGPPRFLLDEVFATRFRQVLEELKIVEYYYMCAPDGMLMIAADGTPYLLLVQNEEAVRSAHEIALSEAAPEDLLTALSSERFVPYFWKTEGRYSPIYDNWNEFLYPAQELQGNECYLYSIVKNPPGFNSKHLVSYDAYLGYIDDGISVSA